MKKVFSIFLIQLLILISHIYPSFAGDANITTYYPSPYGSYDQIRLVPQAVLPANCALGSLAVDASNKLNYCKMVSGVATWTQSFSSSALWNIDTTTVPPGSETLHPVTPGTTNVNNTVNVGIGTSTPTEVLDVIGDLSVTAGSILIGGDLITLNDIRTTLWGVHSDGDITSTGKIATIGPITAVGNMYAQTYYYNSDKDLKKDITSIKHPMKKTMSLKGVSFNWKKSKAPSLGFIAQDVENILPELVHSNDKDEKSVLYGNIIPLLIETMKIQEVQINQFENNVKTLEMQLKQLKDNL